MLTKEPFQSSQEVPIRSDELETEVVRGDATTASGYREVTEDGLFQFGHSKDDPSLPQIKMMTASLDPLGMPLAIWRAGG